MNKKNTIHTRILSIDGGGVRGGKEIPGGGGGGGNLGELF